MNLKRRMLSGALVALAAASSASTTQASHTHAKLVGNGECVVLAEAAGEESVNLPDTVFTHNPNASVVSSPGRNHPLHVLVHSGVAGQSGDYYVHGSAEASTGCNAGYVNR